jgi:nucleotide-binding universal stress UspA family protein
MAHALAAAHVASELAMRLRHRLVVVHATREARSGMDSPAGIVRAAVEAVGGEPTSSVVERGPPAEVLRAVARREDGAAIVVAQRGAGGTAALLGSVAASLLSSSDVPVVVLSETAERRAGSSAAGPALPSPG